MNKSNKIGLLLTAAAATTATTAPWKSKYKIGKNNRICVKHFCFFFLKHFISTASSVVSVNVSIEGCCWLLNKFFMFFFYFLNFNTKFFTLQYNTVQDHIAKKFLNRLSPYQSIFFNEIFWLVL